MLQLENIIKSHNKSRKTYVVLQKNNALYENFWS